MSAAHQHQRGEQIRHRRVLLVMCLALATVVSAVASLNVALPDLARDTGASQTELQWIVNAYALVFAALLLPAGSLGERFGRRRVLLIGLAIFGTGSLAAMAVDDPTALIALRAVLGVGAALVMPATLSLITTEFPPDQRERAVGVWAGVAGASAILGLLAAGTLLEFASWTSVFALNAVLAALAIVGARAVPESADPGEARLDPVGAWLSATGLGAIVYAIIEGPERGWGDTLTLGALGLGAAALAGFGAWELRRRQPMLDPRLFRGRRFAAGTLSITLQFLAFFGFVFLILQYLQLVKGMSPLTAALGMVPMALTLMTLARRAPKIVERLGVRRAAPLGLALMALGFATLALLDTTSTYWLLLAGLVPLGAGMGLATTPATHAIVSGLPQSKQGVGSAVNDAAREVGGALGIAILGSILNDAYRTGMVSAVRSLPPELAEPAQHSLGFALQLAERGGNSGPDLAAIAQQAFVDGLSTALGVAALTLTATAVLVAMLLRDTGRQTTAPPARGNPGSGVPASLPARPSRGASRPRQALRSGR